MNDEYLTIKELADRLKVAPKTVRNKMAAGIFKKGTHYFSRPGLGPRFKWTAVVEWLEEQGAKTAQTKENSIPMARGYRLGQSRQASEMWS